MRKLLFLAPLVLVATVWLYGCDETPVEPESAIAATVTQEGPAPTFKAGDKPPTLPTPVALSGLVIVELGRNVSVDGPSTAYSYSPCPEGKAPITGGIEYQAYGDAEVEVLGSVPYRSNEQWGWKGIFRLTGTQTSVDIGTSAICADASRD